jgi:predicted TIM-barrel fold metal-dependent hydrolase
MILDCHNHIGVELGNYMAGNYPYGQDLPTLVNLDPAGRVDRWVLFPHCMNLSFTLESMRDGELKPGGIESVPYALENRRMLHEIHDLFPDLAPRIIPFVILDPLRKTQEQVAVLRELREQYPIYGLKIQATVIQSDVTALLREGRCFLEFAAEFNLPFVIHTSYLPSDIWSQSSDILKVAEATPEVRFNLAHSCRYERVCLDRIAELPNTWFDCSAHRIHVEAVQRGLPIVAPEAERFPANYDDPTAVLLALAEAYPDKLLWGSDSPAQSWVSGDIDLLSTYTEELDCILALPDDLRQKAACDNILDWLQLPDDHELARR